MMKANKRDLEDIKTFALLGAAIGVVGTLASAVSGNISLSGAFTNVVGTPVFAAGGVTLFKGAHALGVQFGKAATAYMDEKFPKLYDRLISRENFEKATSGSGIAAFVGVMGSLAYSDNPNIGTVSVGAAIGMVVVPLVCLPIARGIEKLVTKPDGPTSP